MAVRPHPAAPYSLQRYATALGLVLGTALTVSGCVIPVPVPPSDPTRTEAGVDDYDDTDSSTSGANVVPEPAGSTATAATVTDDIIPFSGFDTEIVHKLFTECIPNAVSAPVARTALAPCAEGEGLDWIEAIVEDNEPEEVLTYYSGHVVDHQYMVRKSVDQATDEVMIETFVQLCVNTHDGEAYHTYRVADLGESYEIIDGLGEDWGWDCDPMRE